MLIRWAGFVAAVVFCLTPSARAQVDVPAETLWISGSEAYTWMQDDASVVLVEGPVSIQLDRNVMTAQQAVIWVTPLAGSVSDTRRVEISLVGEAKLVQPNGIERAGGQLYIDARTRGPVRVSAGKRLSRDLSETDLYRTAARIRPVLLQGGRPSGEWRVDDPSQPGIGPTTQPSESRLPLQPVTLSADRFETDKTPEGKVVVILSGNMTIVQRRSNGELLELLADRAVIFTPFTDLKQIGPADQLKGIEQSVTGAYLEGDVRMVRTPAGGLPDQRMSANRAFYDFTTDRAVLTDVVLQTAEPARQLPIMVRARMVRQLSENEYATEKSRLSTSSFATPSFSIGASSVYMRQTHQDDPVTGTRTQFVARDATLNFWGLPVFYSPVIAGTVAERNVLRQIETSGSSSFGFGLTTQWGLFETFGRLPPAGTDFWYTLAWFAKRGPMIGLDGKYAGSSVDELTAQPWSYSGDFVSSLVLDSGEDDLGANRREIEHEDDLRGRVYWRHQHFLPEDWQLQVTGGYISDETFLEEWADRTFRISPPLDTSLYLKRQRDSEAITFLISAQPNDFVTVADLYQEQAEIERLPEIGYHRVGDSFFNDTVTFYSANTLSGMQFKPSDASLEDLGFVNISPGLSSFGQTGTPDDWVGRGDFRQELTWPISVGRVRAMPYVIGRYTQYTESVDGSAAERLYAGGGVRVTTAFWKTDDSYQSKFWDINRLRHVMEPAINAYAGVQSTDRAELLIYDEPIDAITDLTAVQVALRQRWQTKRGGPGRWRSTDFFTLNVAYNHFFDQPPEAELNPVDFRGLYYVSRPETSIPRQSVNADASWRVTESFSIDSNVYYNTDESMLAAASIGARITHVPTVSYFLGLRHIGVDIDQVVNGNQFIFDDMDLIIAAFDYQLTSRYRLTLAGSYDLAQDRSHAATATLTRRFDRLYASISFRVDKLDDDSALVFNFWPEGMQPGTGSRGLFSE